MLCNMQYCAIKFGIANTANIAPWLYFTKYCTIYCTEIYSKSIAQNIYTHVAHNHIFVCTLLEFVLWFKVLHSVAKRIQAWLFFVVSNIVYNFAQKNLHSNVFWCIAHVCFKFAVVFVYCTSNMISKLFDSLHIFVLCIAHYWTLLSTDRLKFHFWEAFARIAFKVLHAMNSPDDPDEFIARKKNEQYSLR